MKRALITWNAQTAYCTRRNCCWPRGKEVTGHPARFDSTPRGIDHLYVDPHQPGARPFLHAVT